MQPAAAEGGSTTFPTLDMPQARVNQVRVQCARDCRVDPHRYPQHPDPVHAGGAADGGEAVAAALRERPDVVLMDIRMPEMDGLEATRRILMSQPGSGCRIIMLTTFDLDRYVYEALAAGASGFLLKHVSPEYLVTAVRLVRSGDALLAPSITRRLVERFAPQASAQPVIHRDLSSLTPRELEVLRLLARGMSNAELAAKLTLSEATIKTHVANILAKLRLRDRVQAVVVAYEMGLATPSQPEP
jgi:DNA-binding NarL/FixJ family response regulator